VPFALLPCERRLRELGCKPTPFRKDGELFLSDNGNYIIDCAIAPLSAPAQLERDLVAIPGVVGTGLFLGMANVVLVGDSKDFRLIDERHRDKKGSNR
jgi:ribose 5-phosphate isomerase A